jgi:hypothetical protein
MRSVPKLKKAVPAFILGALAASCAAPKAEFRAILHPGRSNIIEITGQAKHPSARIQTAPSRPTAHLLVAEKDKTLLVNAETTRAWLADRPPAARMERRQLALLPRHGPETNQLEVGTGWVT